LPVTSHYRDTDNEVAQLFWGRVPVQHAASYIVFTKGSRYRDMLHEIKYRGQYETGMILGKMFGKLLSESSFNDVDLIHPVPLHKTKLRKRGFNQSEWIARGISIAMDKPLYTNLIDRIEDSVTQTKKGRYERWLNMKGMFRINNEHLLLNKHILLVDDIITTGATLESCAGEFMHVKGVKISIAALAFAKI